MSLQRNKRFFSKVKIAREVLKEKSEEILQEYLEVVKLAKERGDFETAAKALQWLIDHMPSDEDGNRMVEGSVDKKQEVVQTGPTGPAIQIGIMVGGSGQKEITTKKPSELPEAVIIEDE